MGKAANFCYKKGSMLYALQEMSKHSSGKGSIEQIVMMKELNQMSLPSNASYTAKAGGRQKSREKIPYP